MIQARRKMITVPRVELTDALQRLIEGLPGFKKWTPEDGMTFVASRAHYDMFREAFPNLGIEDCDGTIASLTQTIDPIVQRARLGKARGGALWEHQNRGLDIIGSRAVYGLFYDMGTGKSAIIVQGACELHAAGLIDRALVISTTRGKRAFMDEQLPEWTPDGSIVVAALMPTPQGVRVFETVARSALKMAVVSPGAFQSKKQARELFNWCKAGPCAIFIDECQNFKGWGTRRIELMRHFIPITKYRFLFSGEPMPLGYEDLYSQFFIMDARIIGHNSFYSFRNVYCIMGGYEQKNIVAYKNIPHLVKQIAPHCEFLSIDACLDMPDRNWQIAHYEPTAEQRRIYQRLEEDFLITSIKKDTNEEVLGRLAISAAAQVSLMAQVSNGFYYKAKEEREDPLLITEDDIVWITDERARYTLEELVGDADKCIIWCRFVADIIMLEKVADELGIPWVEISGRIGGVQSEEARKAFTLDKRVRLLIGTTETGGESLNLQVAHRSIYFSNSYNFGKREQSERRIWRGGQKESCWFIDVEGFPIDRVIRRNLKEKRDMASMLKTAVGRAALAEELRA